MNKNTAADEHGVLRAVTHDGRLSRSREISALEHGSSPQPQREAVSSPRSLSKPGTDLPGCPRQTEPVTRQAVLDG